MNIAIIGYGKMGRKIEELAHLAGHDIVLKITRDNQQDLTVENLQKADVAIEFSRPDAAVKHLKLALDSGIPIVSGTTGWLADFEEITNYCKEREGAFFYASNFSIGVYLFSNINNYLSKIMNQYPSYKVSMEEVHHTQKLDAPSGTAISLAKDIIERSPLKTDWSNNQENVPDNIIPITSKRIDKVPGTHSISWDSPIDSIRIEHIAHSREGFAKGALTAAEWIIGKKGSFNMKDLIGF